jgi:hypothetical protein
MSGPYTASVPFHGDTEKAFGLAESALTSIGFRIVQRTDHALDLVGPGMNSSRESALVGASQIQFRHGHGELAVEAKLGGVERMSRFVTLFPIGLCLFLFVVFSVIFGFVVRQRGWVIPVAGATGGIAVLWLLLGPVMARGIRARTCRGLDALVSNMVAVGASDA